VRTLHDELADWLSPASLSASATDAATSQVEIRQQRSDGRDRVMR